MLASDDVTRVDTKTWHPSEIDAPCDDTVNNENNYYIENCIDAIDVLLDLITAIFFQRSIISFPGHRFYPVNPFK